MTQQTFDSLTRRASVAISRRASLATLGGAGLAALTESSVIRAAKNPKKKARKQGKKKCKKQVEQCRAFWEDYCELSGAVNCEEFQQPVADCCEFLGQCQMAEFFDCLAEAENGREPE